MGFRFFFPDYLKSLETGKALRSSFVGYSFLGKRILVHNGFKFFSFQVKEFMAFGFSVGFFSFTKGKFFLLSSKEKLRLRSKAKKKGRSDKLGQKARKKKGIKRVSLGLRVERKRKFFKSKKNKLKKHGSRHRR